MNKQIRNNILATIIKIVAFAVVFPLSDVLKDALPKVAYGSCLVVAALLILSMLIYDFCCLVNKVNPYQLFRLNKSTNNRRISNG